MTRGPMTEAPMRLLTYLELSRYSKAQLLCVIRRIQACLPFLACGSRRHETALMNLRHARIFLDRLERARVYVP